MTTYPIDDSESAFLAGRLLMAREMLAEARTQKTPLLTLVRQLQRTHEQAVDALNDRITTVLRDRGVPMRVAPFNLKIQQQPLSLVADFASEQNS